MNSPEGTAETRGALKGQTTIRRIALRLFGWVAWRRVTPEYFRALDIPVIRGRGFTDEESTRDVPLVVLSRTEMRRQDTYSP